MCQRKWIARSRHEADVQARVLLPQSRQHCRLNIFDKYWFFSIGQFNQYIYKYWDGSAVYSEYPSPWLSLQAIFFFAELNFFMNLVFIFRHRPDLYLDTRPDEWARATSAACIFQPTRKSATADQIAVESQITNYDVFARLLFGIFGLVHHQHYAIRHKVRCSWRCFCHQSNFNFRPGTDTRLPLGCQLQPKNLHSHISSQSFSCYDTSDANKRPLVSILPL